MISVLASKLPLQTHGFFSSERYSESYSKNIDDLHDHFVCCSSGTSLAATLRLTYRHVRPFSYG